MNTVCDGCNHRDSVINRLAGVVAHQRLMKMAYRAALIEVAGDVDFRTVLQKHMERLQA